LADHDIVVIEETDEDNGYDWFTGFLTGGELYAADVDGFVTAVEGQIGSGDRIQSLTLVGHGLPGRVSMGDGQTTVDGKYIANTNVTQWQAAVARLNGRFTTDAVVTLRGCNTGAEEAGADLLLEVADTLNVTVTAPTGTCYPTHCTGDWVTATPGVRPTPKPAAAAKFKAFSGMDGPGARPCCLLIDTTPLGSNFGDLSSLKRHVYSAGRWEYMSGAEWSGIVYTCTLGFVDLGHMRDCIDQTRWLHDALTRKNKTGDAIWEPAFGSTITLKSDVPAAKRADVAAAIVYDMALSHEIETYYLLELGGRGSAFSPEDCVSNFSGTYVARRALAALARGEHGGDFDTAVTVEIETFLTTVVTKTKAEAEAAYAAVKGVWVSGDVTDLEYLKHRNFGCRVLEPWTVDGVSGCDSSTPPDDFQYGVPDADRAYYQMSVPLRGDAATILGAKLSTDDFDDAITVIRADVVARLGAGADAKP